MVKSTNRIPVQRQQTHRRPAPFSSRLVVLCRQDSSPFTAPCRAPGRFQRVTARRFCRFGRTGPPETRGLNGSGGFCVPANVPGCIGRRQAGRSLRRRDGFSDSGWQVDDRLRGASRVLFTEHYRGAGLCIGAAPEPRGDSDLRGGGHGLRRAAAGSVHQHAHASGLRGWNHGALPHVPHRLRQDAHAEPPARARSAVPQRGGRPTADHPHRGSLEAHQGGERVGGGGGASARLVLRLLREDQVLSERRRSSWSQQPLCKRSGRLHGHGAARRHHEPGRSCEAAAADVQLSVPRRAGLRGRPAAARGPRLLLPQLHHPADHERALPGAPLHDLRVPAGAPQPPQTVQPLLSRGVGRARRRRGRRRHHPPGRLQDPPQHAGGSGHPRDPGGGGGRRRGGRRAQRPPHLRPGRGLPDRLQDGGRSGVLQGRPGQDHLPDALHRHQLVRLRVLQVRPHQEAAPEEAARRRRQIDAGPAAFPHQEEVPVQNAFFLP